VSNSKLGPIRIDNRLLDAIRDDRLVIFAGAGVSMGPPACLPNFIGLADKAASGTGLVRLKGEPIDRFLGRLDHREVNVHELVARHLAVPDSAPTTLHLNLLRLFRNPESVRLVTTNFDLHFQAAAQQVFGQCPEVFCAPALPLGRDFRGLVHVHGALTHPREMVLTDTDFGRGYLTEGWARRFLVEVFRTFTVMFVGYSHDDVVMNYLARALPANENSGRYALTHENDKWEILGITPILFRKTAEPNEFQELYDGIHCLAERVQRGALDWRNRMVEVGRGAPPLDEETAGEIDQALREAHTTRFFCSLPATPNGHDG
jgi:hypothetical protein